MFDSCSCCGSVPIKNGHCWSRGNCGIGSYSLFMYEKRRETLKVLGKCISFGVSSDYLMGLKDTKIKMRQIIQRLK